MNFPTIEPIYLYELLFAVIIYKQNNLKNDYGFQNNPKNRAWHIYLFLLLCEPKHDQN